jgi:hypothetical protein
MINLAALQFVRLLFAFTLILFYYYVPYGRSKINLALKHLQKLIYIITILTTITLFSCNSRNSKNIIPEDEFIDILTELHFYDAVLTEKGLYDRKLKDSTDSYYNYVLIKNNMSRSRFDSSLAYYAYDLENFNKMYDQVIENLKHKTNVFRQRKSIFNLPTRILDSIAETKKYPKRFSGKREIWTKKKIWFLPEDGKLEIINFEKKICGQSSFELSANYKIYPDDKTIKLSMLIYVFYSDGSNNTALNRDFVKDGKWHTHKITIKTVASKAPVKIIVKVADHNRGTKFKHLEVKDISLKQKPTIVKLKKPVKKKTKEVDAIKNNIKPIEKTIK